MVGILPEEKAATTNEINKGEKQSIVVEKKAESKGTSSWIWILTGLMAVAGGSYYFLKIKKRNK